MSKSTEVVAVLPAASVVSTTAVVAFSPAGMSPAAKPTLQLPEASTVASRVTPSKVTETAPPGSVVPVRTKPSLASSALMTLSPSTGVPEAAKFSTSVSTRTLSVRVRVLPALSVIVAEISAV